MPVRRRCRLTRIRVPRRCPLTRIRVPRHCPLTRIRVPHRCRQTRLSLSPSRGCQVTARGRVIPRAAGPADLRRAPLPGLPEQSRCLRPSPQPSTVVQIHRIVSRASRSSAAPSQPDRALDPRHDQRGRDAAGRNAAVPWDLPAQLQSELQQAAGHSRTRRSNRRSRRAGRVGLEPTTSGL
jgi:hypothetical protein